MESRNCQNCKQNFDIQPEDFVFYEKIKVPPPTFCPDCRAQRRMIFRNERGLHKRKSDATGKDIVSIYHPAAPAVVYEHDYWYSDAWNPLDYGKEYDFSRPFFEQFKELLERTPTIALFDSKSTNTNFCNIIVEHKNCYLVSAGWGSEDCMYMNRAAYCRDSLDLYVCQKNDLCYENISCKDSYKLFWSDTCENCTDSYFLYDCRGSSNCFASTNLRNKQYYIFNEPYSKEEYFKKLAEFDLGNYETVEKIKSRVKELRLNAIHKYAMLTKCVNVVGNNVTESRDCYHCFDFMDGAENVKYSHWSSGTFKDSYDTGPGTGGNSELLYEGISIGVNNSNCKFGAIIWYSQNVQYSYFCQSSNNLFGCANLRGKSYCILNKQYTKEEYETLVPKIIEQMNAVPYVNSQGHTYRYGEFFPPELSPFPYNDTVARDFFPLSKEEIVAQGYHHREADDRKYSPTVQAANLSLRIQDTQDSITNEIIECSHAGTCQDGCATAYRITPKELEFYRKLNLPLPRFCFNCRHQNRFKQRTPIKLWKRTCMCKYPNHDHKETSCANEFETSFSPDRKETIYCESCYNAEVA